MAEPAHDNRECVRRLREVVRDGDRVAILLQDDPDPDGIASGMALRAVLGRNKATTPIVTLGKVTRPENLAMLRLLDVEVHPIGADELGGYDRVAMLDCQPAYFKGRVLRVDVVIDHHPLQGNGTAPFVDVRRGYGATATILTEYLQALGEEPTERVATALLYGIKSDTLMLNRATSAADLAAFTYLYPRANVNILRKIERPELPLEFAGFLARALRRLRLRDGVLTLYLGAVQAEDVIPRLADFCLQFEGAEWVVVAGKCEGRMVISVRNVGFVRSAGEVVRRLFGGFGSAGGHRAMAKAVVPFRAWRRAYGTTRDRAAADTIAAIFHRELRSSDVPAPAA